MKSDEQSQRFLDLSAGMLAQYDIGDYELRFLAQGGNITFRVDAPQRGSFLLRLHLPISAFWDPIWRTQEVIESELLWLAALHRETTLMAPEPVQNREGRWVTTMPLDNSDAFLNGTLLHWVAGEPITHYLPAHATQVGALVARLHQHSCQWALPQGFTRPKRDGEWLHAHLPKLRRGIEIGTVSVTEYEALEVAVERLQPLMKNLGEARDTWGLIHGDLHPGNYLLHQTEIRPIDFSACSFGYYLYEVGDTIRYLPPQYYLPFLGGYQSIRPLPDGYTQIIEAFLIAGMVSNLAYLALHPGDYEELKRTVQAAPHAVNERLQKYLNDEPFLLNS